MTKLLLFDCFPLFLHFLTSLMKLILWLKFFTDKRQAEDMGGVGGGVKDHRVLLLFKSTKIIRYFEQMGVKGCSPELQKEWSGG